MHIYLCICKEERLGHTTLTPVTSGCGIMGNFFLYAFYVFQIFCIKDISFAIHEVMHAQFFVKTNKRKNIYRFCNWKKRKKYEGKKRQGSMTWLTSTLQLWVSSLHRNSRKTV